MARAATTKKTTRARKRPVKKNNKASFLKRINYLKLLCFLALVCLLVFSLLTVGYVIFFQTVVAAELPFEEHDLQFEELSPPGRDATAGSDRSGAVKKEAQVAIIIDDMGYHQDVGRDLIALDLFLSFSFLPHAPFTQELEEMAYQKGKPVLLHLPLEPRSAAWDPGPGALYLRDDPQTREKTFRADLQLVPHATGVNNHMGSRFTENRPAMEELLELVAEEQLFFIDSFTTSASTGMESAKKKGVPTSRRHVFLDNVQEQEAICRQIEKLVTLADHQGYAIGIGHPYPETLFALQSCGQDTLGRVRVVGIDALVE